MKKSLLFLVFGVLFLASCQKEVEPVTPQNTTPVQVRDITVDYTLYAASGNAEMVVLIQESNGTWVEKTIQVTRMNETVSFTTKSQQNLMIKARNTNPSHDEIMVSIYVDGLLFQSASTTGINTWATATGSPL